MRATGAPVLVVDFGAQYAQLIARRVREAGIYSEIVPSSTSVNDLARQKPAAVILSGGPSSVYERSAPNLEHGLFDLDVPVFGICYGFQLIADALGGVVEQTAHREYGSTKLSAIDPQSKLLGKRTSDQPVWMSHGDAVTKAPPGFRVTASTQKTPVAAFEATNRPIAGVQFHPEVLHTADGQQVIENFLFNVARLKRNWSPANIIDEKVQRIRAQIGPGGRAICGLSGGVDSAVAAALVQRAIGDRLTCVFVDHGLLRQGEAEQVEHDFVKATGVTLRVVDAAAEFAEALRDVTEPEKKRKIIGAKFIDAFDSAAVSIIADSNAKLEYLVQGTLYPDVVESGGGTGAAVIKSHHNVGGLPEDLKFQLVEPLRDLFKDEVRQIGRQLGLPEEIVGRQPFPGPGLAIRIIGAVTAERLEILRHADAIVREEMTLAGADADIWQFPVVLLADVRSVGVQGDGRTYGHPIVLRPITSEDAMTADWARLPHELLAKVSTRITNEVREVNRVVLDVTSKPPGSIEWE